MSTGIYGYPVKDATHIALDATRLFLDTPDGDKVVDRRFLDSAEGTDLLFELDRVIFVVWSNKDRDIYRFAHDTWLPARLAYRLYRDLIPQYFPQDEEPATSET